MSAAGLLARRLVLPAGEVTALSGRLDLLVPPGFEAPAVPVCTDGLLVEGTVHPSVAAGLTATCSPQVGVLLTSSVGDMAGAFGVRADLGGSLLRAGSSPVEVGAWPPQRLGAELARAVPELGDSPLPTRHVPLHDLPAQDDLRAALVGTLRATIVAPPAVLGQVVWLATGQGWLALEPAEVHAGQRWATVRPVQPTDIGAAVAPFVAMALA